MLIDGDVRLDQVECDPFAGFRFMLAQGDVRSRLAAGVIGHDTEIDGPFGRRKLLYADYVASGRAVEQVERFIIEAVLPFYSNSHTEASYCGSRMNTLRRAARKVVADHCGADGRHAVLFTGAGATAGINRLVGLLGVSGAAAAGDPPLVILGPYEHHSNILPWRESGAEIVEISEDEHGGPLLAELDEVLRSSTGRRRICAFSAASNVTGIVTDVAAVTRLAKAAGALMIWDYAGGGPYLPISMSPAPDAEIDAIVLSPHKFVGGPGASGVTILRRDAVSADRPTLPGGGTVRFVSPWGHDYSAALEDREEAGTPNLIGDIRAALAILVKEAIGEKAMARRNAELTRLAFDAWENVPGLQLLGSPDRSRLPIFSFRVADGAGGLVHHQLVTRMLSDCFGIQARGGCACAGPYIHRLLDIDRAASASLRQAIMEGDELAKPGFVRLNFSVLLSDEEVRHICDAVARLPLDAPRLQAFYEGDRQRAVFRPVVPEDATAIDAPTGLSFRG